MASFLTNLDFLIRTCFTLEPEVEKPPEAEANAVVHKPHPVKTDVFRTPSPSEKTESVLSFATLAENSAYGSVNMTPLASSSSSCVAKTSAADLRRKYDVSQDDALDMQDIAVEGMLWSGRFGSSLLAKYKDNKSKKEGPRVVALNAYHKCVLNDTYQQHIPQREVEILKSFDHPFVSSVLGTFSDRNCLYLVSPVEVGGPLSHLLQNSLTNGITDAMKTFYAGCVLSVLKYAHSKNIIYRGLHPDSLLVDSRGYLKVTDWGFAKVVTDRTYTLCGHVEYLCPEAIAHDCGYGKGADYWALGVLIYEMFVGRSAFVPSSLDFKYDVRFEDRVIIGTGGNSTHGSNAGAAGCVKTSKSSSCMNNHDRLEDDIGMDGCDGHDSGTIENILTKEPIYPSYMPHPAKSIIQGLCQKNVTQRLGTRRGGKGIEDIFTHVFFLDIQWGRLNKKLMDAPWIPTAPDTEDADCLPSSVTDYAKYYPNYLPKDKVDSELLQGPCYTGYNCSDWNYFHF